MQQASKSEPGRQEWQGPPPPVPSHKSRWRHRWGSLPGAHAAWQLQSSPSPTLSPLTSFPGSTFLFHGLGERGGRGQGG